MQTETLTLDQKLDSANATALVRLLKDISGVRTADMVREDGVRVDYDDEQTSLQVLRAQMRRAGFRMKSREHGEEGMCCGSCGG